MRRRLFRFASGALLFLFLLSMPFLSGKPGRAADETVLTDELHDLSKVQDYANFATSTWRPQTFADVEGDTYRAVLNESGVAGSLVYHAQDGFTGFTIKVFRNGSGNPPMTFAISTDNATWTDVPLPSPQSTSLTGGWYFLVYEVSGLAAANYLKIDLAGTDPTWKNRIAAVIVGSAINDELHDLSLTYSSTNFKTDTYDAITNWDEFEGDNYRAERQTTDPAHLVYHYDGLTGFEVRLFRNGTTDPPVTFSISADGTAWTAFTTPAPTKSNDLGGSWFFYTYQAADLTNANYLKIEITGSDDTYKNKIASVILRAPAPSPSPSASPSPPPEAIVDEFDNQTTLASVFERLRYTDWENTSNWDEVEGDGWRVERTTDGQTGVLVYQWNWEGATDFKVQTFRNGTESIPQITFSLSADGQAWTDITAQVQKTSSGDLGGYWFYDTHDAANLDATYKYLKIEIGTNREVWALKIAKVLIWPHGEGQPSPSASPTPTASPAPPPSGGCAPGGGGGGGCRPSGMR